MNYLLFDKIFPIIFVVIFVVSIFGYAYIKLRYPFWNIQPVFHTYDFWRYWYSRPFIIQRLGTRTNTALITKFCDFAQIRTRAYTYLTNAHKLSFIDLLQSHYIADDRVFMTWTPAYLDIMFGGYSNACFVSMFFEREYQLVKDSTKDSTKDSSNNSVNMMPITITHNPVPIGCISSRPYNLYIYDDGYSMTKYIAYFFDTICVHRDHVKKQLSRKLIQTHEYNQRSDQRSLQRSDQRSLQRSSNNNMNSSVSTVSFFKKEGDLCEGIVPVLSYKTYMYKIPTLDLGPHTIISRVFKENTHLVQEFFENIHKTGDFDIVAVPAISAIIAQIRAQKLFVYVLKHKDESLGYYFFKDTATQFERGTIKAGVEDCNILEFCASYSNTKMPGTVFYNGFLCALCDICRLYPLFGIILWSNIADNTALHQRWQEHVPHMVENPTAYYLYNMASPKKISAKRGFFLI